MPMFRKKPVTIEAYQVPAEGEDWSIEMLDFLYDDIDPALLESQNAGSSLVIHTLEGAMTAQPGDWIIRGVKGELYPCKPDIFEATYVNA